MVENRRCWLVLLLAVSVGFSAIPFGVLAEVSQNSSTSRSVGSLVTPSVVTSYQSMATHSGSPSPSATTDDISVAGYDSTSIALSWAESGDWCFDDYRIQDATQGDDGPWNTIETISTAGVTSMIVGGFSPGDTTWFQDIDDSGCSGGSATSNVVSATNPGDSSLTYADTSTSSVTLTWTNTASYGGLLSFDSYQVEEAVNGGGFTAQPSITAQTPMSSTITGITGLNTGTEYQFYVVTTDQCNDCSSSWSTTSNSNTVTHLYIKQPTASPTALDVGQTTSLTVTAQGGVPPYSYSWASLPAGCSSTNSDPLSCAPTGAGTSSITVTVTDNSGVTLTSLPVTVTVSSLPTVSSFTVTSASVDTGSTVTFQVVASGGTGSLTYAYSNLPNGCASVDADSLQCTPNATGTYTVKVTVTDSVGGSTSATVALSVSQPNGGGILGGGSSSSGDLILVVVLVVVLVVIGIVVAVVLMRRKKGKPYPTQPQTPPNTYSQPWPQGYSPPPQGPIPPPPPY